MTEPSREAGTWGQRLTMIVGTTLFCLLWVLALAAVGTVGLEFLLSVRGQRQEKAGGFHGPKVERLDRAYAPFALQHLHPQYFSFFPFDPRERAAISNETCSIDADGFRGPGPGHSGGRRLAFLLGGSTAFGLFASSDRTTIAEYLNRSQDEYFFVNAGVPGWTTTQELFRVAFQVVDYRPSLIVTLDGANDAIMLDADDPPGMPEGFSSFEGLVEERAPSSGKRVIVSLMESLLPELLARVEARRHPGQSREQTTAGSKPFPESALRAGAERYWSNLARMHDLATAQGARFIALFQPAAQLHRHLGHGAPLWRYDAISRFHQAVIARKPDRFEFHDLASVFDQYLTTIPVINPDIADDTVFVDQVHLYDPGNEILARHLALLIR